MGIAQGATPYLMLTIQGYDLTDADACVVALKTAQHEVDLDLSRITITSDEVDSLLTVHLTQEETLSLMPSVANVQVRWRANGEAHTTEMAKVNVASAIYKGVI